jgi:hypothetical protein
MQGLRAVVMGSQNFTPIGVIIRVTIKASNTLFLFFFFRRRFCGWSINFSILTNGRKKNFEFDSVLFLDVSFRIPMLSLLGTHDF